MSNETISNQNNQLEFLDNTYTLNRYPHTSDDALRAWSNAEILAANYTSGNSDVTETNDNLLANVNEVHIFNDRFGVWNNLLSNDTLNVEKVTTVIGYASQQKAIQKNLDLNGLSTKLNIKTPLESLDKVELALLKVPKSLELFELFLQQIHKASAENTIVVCGFMTKYFSVSFLKIALKYFEECDQSKAWKKSRVLTLKKPITTVDYKPVINHINYKDIDHQQYFGVFSAEKIDIGTQFLLKNISLQSEEVDVLDLACGNGVIARSMAEQSVRRKQEINLTVIDDAYLAVESAKLNLAKFNTNYLFDDNLATLEDNSFDLVVSNPPFHFEHENNIEVAILLFRDVKRVLRTNGRFMLVANKHLNYITHLSLMFDSVTEVSTNSKFIVYSCV